MAGVAVVYDQGPGPQTVTYRADPSGGWTPTRFQQVTYRFGAMLTLANGGGGTVKSVVAGADITVDSTDPQHPIVAVASGSAVPAFPASGNHPATSYIIEQRTDGAGGQATRDWIDIAEFGYSFIQSQSFQNSADVQLNLPHAPLGQGQLLAGAAAFDATGNQILGCLVWDPTGSAKPHLLFNAAQTGHVVFATNDPEP